MPGVLFVACSNASKHGKKCDEFKSLHQNILKLLFCGHISLLQRKQHHFSSHLTWARGTQFGEGPVLAGHLSESVSPFARNFRPWQHIYSTAQGSNTIVQFVSQRYVYSLMEYHQEHRSWSTCREQRSFAVFETYSLLSRHPSRKKCFSFSDPCIFGLLSSTKSAPMQRITCWKYKQSDILISSCRNKPSQLQSCRTKRFFRVFVTLRVTWRQRLCQDMVRTWYIDDFRMRIMLFPKERPENCRNFE